MRLGPSFEIHEACAHPFLRAVEACQHGRAMHIEADALHDDAGKKAEAYEIGRDQADDHNTATPPPHRDTRMARARVAISVSPSAANACATRSMPSLERAPRA